MKTLNIASLICAVYALLALITSFNTENVAAGITLLYIGFISCVFAAILFVGSISLKKDN